MSDKAQAMIDELVSACIAFGRQVEPDWQTRIDKAQRELREYVEGLEAKNAELKERFDITDGLLNQATVSIGAVIACCTYNSNAEAMAGAYGISYRAFTMIDNFIKNYNRAVLDGKASTDVKNIICCPPNPPEVDENEKHWASNAKVCMQLNEQYESRITELSQALGLITTLKPTMVMDVDHPLDMAKEVEAYVTARIAVLEKALNIDTDLTIAGLRVELRDATARIAELEALVERLIELGDVINGDKDSVWTLQTIKECWTEDVTKWKERE